VGDRWRQRDRLHTWTNGTDVPTDQSNADANLVNWKYQVQHPQVAYATGISVLREARHRLRKDRHPGGHYRIHLGIDIAISAATVPKYGGRLSQIQGPAQMLKTWTTHEHPELLVFAACCWPAAPL
jgi:hypothetical protein